MMSDTSLKEDLIHMYNLQLGRGICFLLCVPSATARQAYDDTVHSGFEALHGEVSLHIWAAVTLCLLAR